MVFSYSLLYLFDVYTRIYKKYFTVGAQNLLQTPTTLHFQCPWGLLLCVLVPSIRLDLVVTFYSILAIPIVKQRKSTIIQIKPKYQGDTLKTTNKKIIIMPVRWT